MYRRAGPNLSHGLRCEFVRIVNGSTGRGIARWDARAGSQRLDSIASAITNGS